MSETGTRQAFPSLLLGREGVIPSGSFAEQQAAYLEPDAGDVSRRRELLEAGIRQFKCATTREAWEMCELAQRESGDTILALEKFT